MSKVILTGYVIVADADLEAVQQALPDHIQLTREEEGCLVFEVVQDSTNKNRFNVYEEFTSKAAFEFHKLRLSTTRWGTISSKLEKHYTTNEPD